MSEHITPTELSEAIHRAAGLYRVPAMACNTCGSEQIPSQMLRVNGFYYCDEACAEQDSHE